MRHRTMAEYALDQLRENREIDFVRRWHALYYLALSEQAEAERTEAHKAARAAHAVAEKARRELGRLERT